MVSLFTKIREMTVDKSFYMTIEQISHIKYLLDLFYFANGLCSKSFKSVDTFQDDNHDGWSKQSTIETVDAMFDRINYVYTNNFYTEGENNLINMQEEQSLGTLMTPQVSIGYKMFPCPTFQH